MLYILQIQHMYSEYVYIIFLSLNDTPNWSQCPWADTRDKTISLHIFPTKIHPRTSVTLELNSIPKSYSKTILWTNTGENAIKISNQVTSSNLNISTIIYQLNCIKSENLCQNKLSHLLLLIPEWIQIFQYRNHRDSELCLQEGTRKIWTSISHKKVLNVRILIRRVGMLQ